MCIRILSVNDTVHFAQLFHQIFLVVKSPRSVNQKHIHSPRLSRADCVIDNAGGVCPFIAAHHGNLCSLCPLSKLVSGSRTESICSGDQYLSAVVLQLSCQLSNRGSLAHSVNSDHHNDRLPVLELIRRLIHTHLFFDAVDQQLLTFGRFLDMFLPDLFL